MLPNHSTHSGRRACAGPRSTEEDSMASPMCSVHALAFIAALTVTSASAQQPAGDEARNMELVGRNDLQARSAYQPVVMEQNGRWILYVGHHGGTDKAPKPINTLTGVAEFNGTSVLDVT